MKFLYLKGYNWLLCQNQQIINYFLSGMTMKSSSVEKKIHYPLILFNNRTIKRVQFHRHLGLTLDSQLNFNYHISSTLSIVNKLTAVLRKLQTVYLGIHFQQFTMSSSDFI